jgi:PTH2 family peptidyl-tRNA hydrolase
MFFLKLIKLNCRYDLFFLQNVIPTDTDTTDETMMTYKMLFIVNGSLRMSSGKMAAQVAHCAIDLYQQILNQRLMSLNFWRIYGQTKIVVRGESTEELLDIESRATVNKSIVRSIIRDAGRTEIASGSITCLGLFGTNNQLDPITGHLKLMNDCLKCSGGNSPQQKTRKNKKDPEPTTNSDDISNT